ncbi:DUF4184 family protein [Flammeovirga sp. SubArs3]|uniref:DUF4184 family protein n=1 Tax=Flammeovirga sp. SubArs3 TaxID=2995316 RepID=UPI00248B1E7B|nr:DUF4184 family protein [Flammeovirga sp. SubArs3]
MPIPIAHPMAVLPLFRYSHFLSVSALIIGSMIPDFEHFLELQVSDKVGHTVFGIFLFDIPAGLMIYYLNYWIIRPVLTNVSPIRFHVYYEQTRHYSFFQILFSLSVGIATHFLLDAITGEEGYFVKDLPYLFTEVQVTDTVTMNIHLIIWIAVSIFGALNCLWLIIISFDWKKTYVRVKTSFWSIQFFIEVTFGIFLISTFRYYVLGDPMILWNWGIVIGGASFFSLNIVCFRWWLALHGKIKKPHFLKKYGL